MMLFRIALLLLLSVAGPVAAEEPRLTAGIGQQMITNDPEFSLRYTGSPYLWDLQPVLGLSVATNGSAWIGAGAALTWRPGHTGLFGRFSSMAGVYRQGSGKDLGGPVQFRTALDVGIGQANGLEFGVGLDHRSNAGLYKQNPGLNSVYLFASMPLR